MDELLGLGDRKVVAMLGPTNTGKTHAAIQRMLAHRTGMIGLPLRLLAREVYERVAAQVGSALVALVTGEEKRIPSTARYWVCTVEAMPVDRDVHFLAVDEIQLMADRVRGHVFTDRLLRARGLMETWFMGSDVAGHLITELVSEVEHERRPRLSELRHSGTSYLTDLPPRSAIVAFSAREVTALAERLRDRRGGAAVVLGALSPRTRNAQVELFQAGEVPYLVATDAIGMGLNLDVHHVALAGLSKFDGVSRRSLSPGEIGQIAGRAGRYHRGGTFGTLEEVGELEPELVRRIERHEFPRMEQAFWRQGELDLSTVASLKASLERRSPHKRLVRVRQAGDEEALAVLSRDPEVRRRAVGRQVPLLWDVCRVPDFRKTLTDDHTDLLRQVFLSLCDRGRIADDFAERRLSRLDRMDGGVDSLTTRIAFVRTWATLAHRRDWFEDPEHWRERAADIEERLSDALHEELTRRFVDRRIRRGWVPSLEGGVVMAEGRPVGQVRGLRVITPGLSGHRGQQVRAAASPVLRARAEAISTAKDQGFSIGCDGVLRYEDEAIGRLVRGPHPLAPEVVLDTDALPGDLVQRVRERLTWWVRQELDGLLSPLRGPMVVSLQERPRAVLARAIDQLGLLQRWGHAEVTTSLDDEDWRVLQRAGLVQHGDLLVLVPMFRGEWHRWRPALARAHWGRLPDLSGPVAPRRVRVGPGGDDRDWERLGYVLRGADAIRLDQLIAGPRQARRRRWRQ